MQYLNDIFPPNSWIRTVTVSIGLGTGILFSIKYALSSRRVWCKNSISLLGKTCIVTGANTGIGKAVAFEFAKRNARVLLACRDVQKGNATAKEIRSKIKSANIEVYHCDLSSFDSIRQCVEAVKQNEDDIDVLVNNAGLMRCPFQLSNDGIEMQFAVNHLGHFLLTNLLLDKLRRGGDTRVIVVASSLYKYATVDLVNFNSEKYYTPVEAYGRSKLANILFSRELSRRLPEGITVNAMHPGIVLTELGRHHYLIKFSYVTKVLFMTLAYFIMKSPIEGAQTIIHLATEPDLEGVSGKYFGDCKQGSLTAHAENTHMGEKLWEISEELTRLKS